MKLFAFPMGMPPSGGTAQLWSEFGSLDAKRGNRVDFAGSRSTHP